MLLLNVSLRPNQRLKAFIQLLKYDVTLVSKGVIIFATANNIEVSQFHYTFSYNGYCWENFYSNLMFVIPSRGQPDVRLPRGEVENEKNGLREWEKSESIMGMGKTSLFLKRAGSISGSILNNFRWAKSLALNNLETIKAEAGVGMGLYLFCRYSFPALTFMDVVTSNKRGVDMYWVPRYARHRAGHFTCASCLIYLVR